MYNLLAIFVILFLNGCLSSGEKYLPKDQRHTRAENRGSMSSDNGLFSFGGSDNTKSGGASIGVNSYLWRATLDTFSFLPIISADPFGGVILTDWYEDPANIGERFKVNSLILDDVLRADGIKISVFKQIKDKNNIWHDVKANPAMARQLENTILTRAREMRVGR